MGTHTHHRSSSDTFRALSRHDVYYLTGGDLFFLAEHIHFRVHRYFFERESPFFQRQLQVPVSPGAVARGSTEGTAIILDKIDPEDFAKFLWVFYNPRYSLYNTSVDDWKVILHLAHMWEFTEVKKLVVRELEKLEMSDVDRIATYQKHEVDKNYLIPRYAALCEREQPLTLSEGMLLGMETTLMIARAREYARSNPSADGLRSPTTAGIQEDEMHSLVRMLFNIQPADQANGDDHTNGTATGSGTGTGSATPAGGLMPPPPPEKPAVVIPPGTPTGKSTVTPTGKPTAQPQDKADKSQQGKKKGKGKAQPTHLPPLETTMTTPVDPELPIQKQSQENQEKEGEGPEPLIDFGEPANIGSQTQEDVVDGAAGDVKTDEPVHSGETGKTEDTDKPVEPMQSSEADEAKKAEGATDDGSKVNDAGGS